MLDNIQRLIDRGYELVIRRDSLPSTRPYHALVLKNRDLATSLNHLGKTPGEALESLERYVGADGAAINGDCK